MVTLLMGTQACLVAPASANHVAGASYAGTAATGGTVSVQISGKDAPDPETLIFSANLVPTTCGIVYALDEPQGLVTISFATADHPFSDGKAPLPSPNWWNYGLRYVGSFPAQGQVSGTLRRTVYNANPSLRCVSDPVAWSATLETGSNRPHRNCKKIKSKKKRKKCQKKQKGGGGGR